MTKKGEDEKATVGIKYGEYLLEKGKQSLKNNVDSLINIR